MDSELRTGNMSEEEKCLAELKNFAFKNPNWTKFAMFMTDENLLHFVRGRKCDIKKVIKSFENYMEVRRLKYPGFFKTMRPSTNACLKSGTVRLLRHRDSEGRAILAIRATSWNPTEVTSDDFLQGVILIGEELGNYSEGIEREGYVLISDATGLRWSHVQLWTNPFQVHKGLDITINNAPLRHKAIHFVKTTFLMNFILNLFYFALPSKLKKRIHIYGRDASSLARFHKEISPDILPESFGGKLCDDEAWDTEFEQRIYAKEEYYRQVAELL